MGLERIDVVWSSVWVGDSMRVRGPLGWGAAALVMACGTTLADPTESGDSGPAAASTSAAPMGATGAAPTTQSPPDDSTGRPVPPATSTTADDGDLSTGPGVSFDLGIVPDAPMDDCQSIDIVFVMDVSTTMGGFIQILADEILAVDAAIQSLDLSSPPQYGLVVFVDDAAIINGGVPYLDAQTLQSDFLMWANFTSSNQQVGGGNGNTTFAENSLDALYLAASDFQWRQAANTTRLVIHTTDDTFWDGPTVGNGIPILHGYAETVTALQDELVRVYAFADDIGGSCSCEDVTPGWSTPYQGMASIPDATDGGVFDIQQVLSGAVTLTDAINGAAEESYCEPYTPA